MLPPDDEGVLEELSRRLARLEKGSDAPKGGAGGEKWKEQHQALAESLGVQWPLTPSAEVLASEWYKTLPEREQQAGHSHHQSRASHRQKRLFKTFGVWISWI